MCNDAKTLRGWFASRTIRDRFHVFDRTVALVRAEKGPRQRWKRGDNLQRSGESRSTSPKVWREADSSTSSKRLAIEVALSRDVLPSSGSVRNRSGNVAVSLLEQDSHGRQKSSDRDDPPKGSASRKSPFRKVKHGDRKQAAVDVRSDLDQSTATQPSRGRKVAAVAASMSAQDVPAIEVSVPSRSRSPHTLQDHKKLATTAEDAPARDSHSPLVRLERQHHEQAKEGGKDGDDAREAATKVVEEMSGEHARRRSHSPFSRVRRSDRKGLIFLCFSN